MYGEVLKKWQEYIGKYCESTDKVTNYNGKLPKKYNENILKMVGKNCECTIKYREGIKKVPTMYQGSTAKRSREVPGKIQKLLEK